MCAQNILLRKDIDIWLCKKQPGVFKSSHHLAAPEVQVYVIFLEVDVRREVTFFCWNGRQSWVLYVKKHLNMAVGVWSLLGKSLVKRSGRFHLFRSSLHQTILFLCRKWPVLLRFGWARSRRRQLTFFHDWQTTTLKYPSLYVVALSI